MAKFFLTYKAIADLSSIWEYTFDTWSERQADKYHEMLTSAFEDIVKQPALGKKYPEIDISLMGFRVGKHIKFYPIINAIDIEIFRILHYKMDLKKRIEE